MAELYSCLTVFFWHVADGRHLNHIMGEYLNITYLTYMYLDSKDYQTIWQLAQNWVGADPEKSDPHLLSDELKHSIHRLMSAAINQSISSRTRRFALFMDESFFTFIFYFHHYKKFKKCLRNDEFDKSYLSSIYLKRGEVLRWCQSEFLSPPPIWQVINLDAPKLDEQIDDSDDDKDKWYDNLSDRRKQRIACLEIAKQLWRENPELSYKEVHSHPSMTRYGYG